MSLKDLEKVKLFAERERKARKKYMSESAGESKRKGNSKVTRNNRDRRKKPSKQTSKSSHQVPASKSSTSSSESGVKESSVICVGCHMTWEEDQSLETGSLWVECDICKNWIHEDCCPYDIPKDDELFHCPNCI